MYFSCRKFYLGPAHTVAQNPHGWNSILTKKGKIQPFLFDQSIGNWESFCQNVFFIFISEYKLPCTQPSKRCPGWFHHPQHRRHIKSLKVHYCIPWTSVRFIWFKLFMFNVDTLLMLHISDQIFKIFVCAPAIKNHTHTHTHSHTHTHTYTHTLSLSLVLRVCLTNNNIGEFPGKIPHWFYIKY